MFPVIVVLLLLGLGLFLYMKKKGGKKKSEGVDKKSSPFKVNMGSSTPAQVKPQAGILKSFKKSAVDKKLEESFGKSSELFKK